MRVTGLLFNPPGKGEFLRKHLDLDDNTMPATVKDYAERSYKAIKHFWPQAVVGQATVVMKGGENGKRVVVECGDAWAVEWADSEHVKWMNEFTSNFMNGKMTSTDYLKVVAKNQLNERISL